MQYSLPFILQHVFCCCFFFQLCSSRHVQIWCFWDFFSVYVTKIRKNLQQSCRYVRMGMGKLLHLMLFILCCCSFNIFSSPSLSTFISLFYVYADTYHTHTASKHVYQNLCEYAMNVLFIFFEAEGCMKSKKSNFFYSYVLLLFRWKEIFIALHDWDALWLIHMESKKIYCVCWDFGLKGVERRKMLISLSIWINIDGI